MGHDFKWKTPGAIASAFVKSRPSSESGEVPIDVIRGPIGSGKTVACIVRMFMHWLEAPKGSDGWRRSKWVVVRNTNPMLETTTIPSYLQWFPEEVFGKFSWSPPYSHTIRLDGPKVEAEVIFMPLDRPDQVRNLLSLEVSGGWINELREIPREIVIALRSRAGRFRGPGQAGASHGWAGVIADTNCPEDEFHYLALWEGATVPPDWMEGYQRTLMQKPEGVNFFIQPPGLIPQRDGQGKVTGFADNPKAENLANLRPGYYRAQIPGTQLGWILNMCANEMTRSGETRLVYPDFDEKLHVAPSPIQFDRTARLRLLVGGDFARNPAFILGQEVGGQLRLLREFIGQNVSVQDFVTNTVVPAINREYPQAEVEGWGDPSGNNMTGGDDSTAFDHARTGGLTLYKGWTNDPARRQQAVTARLTRLANGGPAIIVSPSCATLIQGFKGGYRFEKKKVLGSLDAYHEEPAKNLYSHIHDGLQYLCSNLDRGLARQNPGDARRAARDYQQPNGAVRLDPFAAARAARTGRGR